MKKTLFAFVAALILVCCCAAPQAAVAEGTFETSAQSAVVMERSSRRILYSKNCEQQLPMASTTKIVTALTVLNNADTDNIVEIPKAACGIEGSSLYLRAGEHLTVKELLYGLMLRSGNDCAVALALHVSGSVDAFAELMNKTARECGCSDSNFVNPHGLPDDAHYTTAKDLATITCAAMENAVFRKIAATKTVRISNEGYDYDRVLVNKNKLLSNYEFADGVKTGYTKKAGRCFVGSATKNGMQVVVVVLNCGPMFEETQSLLVNAYRNYEYKVVVPQNKICAFADGSGRKAYVCEQRFCYPLKRDEYCSTELCLDGDAPCIKVYVNGDIVAELPLTVR